MQMLIMTMVTMVMMLMIILCRHLHDYTYGFQPDCINMSLGQHTHQQAVCVARFNRPDARAFTCYRPPKRLRKTLCCGQACWFYCLKPAAPPFSCAAAACTIAFLQGLPFIKAVGSYVSARRT